MEKNFYLSGETSKEKLDEILQKMKQTEIKSFTLGEINDKNLKIIQKELEGNKFEVISLFTEKFSQSVVEVIKSFEFGFFTLQFLPETVLEADFSDLFKNSKNLKKFHIYSTAKHSIDPILKELKSLTHIKELSFFHTKMSDDFYEVLMLNNELEVLKIEGCINMDLGKALKCLMDKKRFETLHLRCDIIDKETTELLREFLVFSFLKTLSLKNFFMDLNILFKDPKEISLNTLLFDKSFKKDEDFKEFTNYLKSNTKIEKLSLQNTHLTENNLKIICQALEENVSIKTIDLNFLNTMIVTSLTYFEDLFQKNHIISSIFIHKLNMKSLLKSFMNGIKLNKSISILMLKSCTFDNSECKFIGECLSENETLKYLTLNGNGISGDGFTEIIKGLENNKSLTYIGCFFNELEDDSCKFLGEYLSKNGNLKSLVFHGAYMTENGINYIMEGMKSNKNITTLKVLSNFWKVNPNFKEMFLYNYTIQNLVFDRGDEEIEPYLKRNRNLVQMMYFPKGTNICFSFQ